MQQRTNITILLFAVAGMLLNACSNTRFLADDQLLYTGLNKTTIINAEHKEDKKAVTSVADAITFHKPNNALFGTKRIMPPTGLWTYNYLKPKKEGKKPGWFYKTFSSEPVLISQVNPEQRCKKIESVLFGIGFFNTKAWFTLDTARNNPHKAKISYYVKVDNPYRINKIFNNPPVDSVDILINSYTEKLNIKPGDIFNLETIKSEKQKISSMLIEQGYYFFGPGHIEIIADTTAAPFQINLMIGKNRETPAYVCRKYSIGQIKVNFIDNQVDSTGQSLPPDTAFYDGITLTGLNNYLKPEVITRCIMFREGDLYSASKHQATIPQLNNYGVFKYVKMQFAVKDTLQQKMDLTIDLSAKNDVSLNLEGFVQSKSSGFAGPGAEVTLAHANIARGANTLQLKLYGGFEWQWGSKESDELGTNSYNMGISSSFVVPRLLLPFKLPNQSKLLVSKTINSVGFEFINNVQYYRMSSVNFGLSYQWKKKQKVTHVFYPLKINIVNLLETTPEFDTIVNNNPYVKKSFEEQTILGMEYNFVYDNTVRKTNGIYFQGIVSTSGNLVDIIKSLGSGERPYTLLGNVYSQFLKTSLDVRYYRNTIKKGLVFRLYSGVGYSYGNSTVMPYLEQFYSGGSNSIRGFAARSLGPGSYKPVDYNGIIDQTGDIKLEFNAEYRFALSKTVLGALFTDVGNVWLLNPDENRPGAQFKFNSFVNQLAVGTGVGLRFDFDFFVLRTDLGFPLRTPYLTDNNNWITNPKDIFSGFLLNIAIGFPF